MLVSAHALDCKPVAIGKFTLTSRRSFLRAAGGTLGATWLTFNWRAVAAAASEAQKAAQSSAAAPTSFLTPPEAAIVEAVAAQIIPSDTTPGAREAGVVFFIDRALATFFAHTAQRFRSQLSEFQRGCSARYPEVDSFARLPNDQQLEWLSSVEHLPFFNNMRQLTVLGMFTMPAYGGNRDGLGWQLLGFQDQHIFEPPFGYYDRDYPGFVIEQSQGK